MLKLNVDVESDKKLRDLIHELVKGQIQKMTRENIRSLLKEVAGDEIEKWIKDEVKKITERYLGDGDYTRESTIRRLAKEVIKEKAEDTLIEVISRMVATKSK